jgi:hypothetical protein
MVLFGFSYKGGSLIYSTGAKPPSITLSANVKGRINRIKAYYTGL